MGEWAKYPILDRLGNIRQEWKSKVLDKVSYGHAKRNFIQVSRGFASREWVV